MDTSTFKQFISEEIAINGEALKISIQNYRAASTKDSISTYFNRQPYTTKIKGCKSEIYSLLNYVSSETTTKILTSLKGKGPLDVPEKQFQNFMSQVKTSAGTVTQRVKPDIIIYPKSSSEFLTKFVDAVSASFPQAEVLPEKFIKAVLDAENVEPLLNTEHPDWEKFARENPKEVEKLKKQLKAHIQRGELELKKLYKPYLKFVKNFIELRDAYDLIDKVLDKVVLVIDDVLSTGTTMSEMIRQLEDIEPSKIVGLTLFKHTVSPK